jgi:predicted TIM-barrel fold metal-dependent hydrolase
LYIKLIIDVHEHIFRGRDIPLKGYLYSRRYPFLANFFGRCLRLLTVLAWCIRRSTKNGKQSLFTRFMVWFASLFVGAGYRRWANILSLPDIEEIVERLVQTFQKDKTDLIVPLMIDYEYWFRNTADVPLWTQIDLVARDVVLNDKYKGRIHPFVPFDPARELAFRKKMANPDGSREKYGSFAIVKDAIENKGFIGVKLYNALGYRPDGNSAVDKKRRKIFRKNRMIQYSIFTGKEIDGVLEELYRYCEREQVPITAHCVAGGIESYYNASYDFGSPAFWHNVLKKHPALHLNLAHLGWNGQECYTGKGTGGNKPWVKEICGMIAAYPFVYSDVAHHEVMVKSNKKEFVTDYTAMCKDFAGVLQRKLLYGIDWHVISRVDNYENFMKDYRALLRDNDFFSQGELENFFGSNALSFLGLLPLKTGPDASWTKNRMRLADFYKRNNIRPPQWFIATGKATT